MKQKLYKDFEFIKESITNEKECQNSSEKFSEQKYLFPRIDNFEAKHEVISIAGRYLENDDFHAHERTDLLLKTLLDIEIYPLKRELTSQEDTPGGLFTSWYQTIKNACSWPIRTVLTLVGLGIRLIQVILIIVAFQEPNELTIPIALISAFLLCKKFTKNFLRNKKLKKLATVLSEMTKIREEISWATYSPQILSEKLKQIESKGGYVYSVVYSLLALRQSPCKKHRQANLSVQKI